MTWLIVLFLFLFCHQILSRRRLCCQQTIICLWRSSGKIPTFPGLWSPVGKVLQKVLEFSYFHVFIDLLMTWTLTHINHMICLNIFFVNFKDAHLLIVHNHSLIQLNLKKLQHFCRLSCINCVSLLHLYIQVYIDDLY